jgi:hypothetical protein
LAKTVISSFVTYLQLFNEGATVELQVTTEVAKDGIVHAVRSTVGNRKEMFASWPPFLNRSGREVQLTAAEPTQVAIALAQSIDTNR